MDLISVAFFNQVTFFSEITVTVYFSFLVQGLLPIAVMPFIYQNKAQSKHFTCKNAHCEFVKQFSCGKCMLQIQSL